MKYFNLLILLFVLTSSFAQTRLEFNTEGKLTSKLKDHYDRNHAFTLSPSVAQTLPNDAQSALRKKFYLKFQRVLDNLTEPQVANFYKVLWGTVTYTHIVDEARALKQFCKDGRRPPVAITYFPGYDEINNIITASSLYELDTIGSYKEQKQQRELKLKYTDPLKSWLVNRYNNDIRRSSFRFLDTSAEYKRLWKNLQSKSDNIKVKLDSLESLPKYRCNVNDYTIFESFRVNEIENDPLLKLFKTDPLIKSWVWFTNGHFSVNPLGFTTPDKIWRWNQFDEKKAILFDSTIKVIIDSIVVCCDADAKKIEDLIKASETGKKIFAEQMNFKEDIFEIESVSQMKETKVVRNKVIIPITINEKKPVYSVSVDAANEYAITNKITKAISEDENAVIAVHNLSAKQKVSLEEAKEKGVDKSEGEKQVDVLADQIGVVVSGLNPFGGLIKKLFSPEPLPLPNNTINFSTATLVTTSIKSGKGLRENDKFFQKILTIDNLPKDTFVSRTATKLLTARELILAYTSNTNNFKPEIVNGILSNCGLLLTLNDNSQTSIENLINAFNELYRNHINRANTIDALKVNLKNSSMLIEALLALKDRSLPPDELTATTAKNPVYRTEILLPDLSDPPVISKIKIIEKSPKADGSDTTMTVAKTEIKVGKLYLFQLSAGIGITLTDYSAKTASVANNQLSVVSTNNQVRLVAGLHIYPWKLFKQDDSFLGIKNGRTKNRFSAYVGVGIPDPLKNYYTGIGVDLIPGFKFIAGGHFFRNYKYKLNNNQVVEENSGIKFAGPFISFSIDPSTVIKALGFFK